MVIQTRWHDDDLSGRLLEAMEHGADQWEVVLYEAVASRDEEYRDKGEALHPDRYSIKQLNKIRTAIGERDWQALYQQRPVADEGAYFKKDMFPRYKIPERPPIDEMNLYTTWDFAIGQKEENDYSVGITCGLCKDGKLWVVDMIRVKVDGYQLVQCILDNFEQWKPSLVGMERGQILMSISVFLDKEIERRKAYGFSREDISPGRNDKQARARAIQGMMQQGMVLFPEEGTTSWVDNLVYEMMRFPSGVHDDCVDSMAYQGYLYRLMTTVPDTYVPPKKSWRDKLNAHVQDDKAKRWQRA